MRLTQKKIEEITLSIIGQEGKPLIEKLYGQENISEFILADKTKMDIKLVRKLLYLLYNHNLVGFNRKKDKEKGWYVYYWTLLPESIRFIYFKKKKESLIKLKSRLEEEEKELFFVCPNDCVRLNFDQAMDFEFHCPECGELFSQDTSEDKIAKIKNKIKEIETEVAHLTEINKVRAAKQRVTPQVEKKSPKKKVVKKKVVKKTTVKKKNSKKKVVKKKIVKKKVIKKKKK
jgi:transcription initiation factor TFIIE subunit alpha